MANSDLMKPVLAGLGAGVADAVILTPLASRVGLGLSDDMIKILGGALASMYGKGMVRSVGNAFVAIGAYNLTRGAVSGISLFGGSSMSGDVAITA